MATRAKEPSKDPTICQMMEEQTAEVVILKNHSWYEEGGDSCSCKMMRHWHKRRWKLAATDGRWLH